MAAKKRIGILTGGGDVPGLNRVIKSLVYRCTDRNGFQVTGIRRGWQGLTHLQMVDGADAEYVVPLDRQITRTVDRQGGTFLHTSRTNPSRMPVDQLPPHIRGRAERFKEVKPGIVDATPVVLENIDKLGLEYLIAIGGDDTLSYASVLHQQGIPIVAVPKTMDNDVHNTEYCIGFSTAMTRAVERITRLRTTVGSHERIGIFRIFGRDAGFTALYAAYVTALRCCIPEVEFDMDRLIEVLLSDKRENPSRYALVALSEGATWAGRSIEQYGAADAYGHRKKVNVAEAFAAMLEEKTGEETTVADLTYELRSGEPDFLDRMVATTFGNIAFECMANRATGRMTAIRNGCYTDTEIPDVARGPRKVDVDAMYDQRRFRPNYSAKAGLPVFLTRD